MVGDDDGGGRDGAGDGTADFTVRVGFLIFFSCTFQNLIVLSVQYNQ
jgi:hypothetical protein